MRLLLVVLLLIQLLSTCFAFSVIPVNKKSQISIQERHENARRSTLGDSPLGGGTGKIGYYFVQLTAGGRQFRVDIDTGSSILYITGAYCHYIEDQSSPCQYSQNYYPANTSAPYQTCTLGCTQCQNSVCIMVTTYGDNSQVYGAVRLDSISAGSYSTTGPVAVTYLETMSFAGNPVTYMDGLWGLAYAPLNGNQPTVMDNLVSSGMPDIFSICLSAHGGYLVLGGIDTSLQTTTPNYTPITTEAFYAITTSSITIGSNSLSTQIPSITIVDSGTTFIYVPSDLYDEMTSILYNNYSMDPTFFVGSNGQIPCWTGSYLSLPDITLTFPASGGGSFPLTLTPSMYMVACDAGGHAFAFGPSPGISMVILGDAFMMNFNVIFDRANSQVGFATASSMCATGSVSLGSTSTVPDTKSPFSSAATTYPSLLLALMATLLMLWIN